MNMRKILFLVIVAGILLVWHGSALATTYIKKTDTVQNFTVLVPSYWTVKAYEKGGQGFVATDRKNVDDNTKAAASTLSIAAYPFTPNEKSVALGNPKLFVSNFFSRMKDFFDYTTSITKVTSTTVNNRKVYKIEVHSTKDRLKVEYDFVLVDTGYYLLTQRMPDTVYVKNAGIRTAILRGFTPTSRTPNIFKTTTYKNSSAGLSFALPNTWMNFEHYTDITYGFARRFAGAGKNASSADGLYNQLSVTVKDISELTTEEVAALEAKDPIRDANAFIASTCGGDENAHCTTLTSHIETFGIFPAVSFRVKNIQGSIPFSTADVLHILHGTKRIEVRYVGFIFPGANDFNSFLGEKSLLLRSVEVD